MPTKRTIDVPDQELVAKTVKGDAAAYGSLYDRYVDQIYRYVYFRINNREEAEDLTETVFLKTFESIQKNRRDIQDLKSWLYRVANNLVADHYRNCKKKGEMEELGSVRDPRPLPEANVLSQEKFDRVRQALESLDRALQEVLIYRFVNGLSYEETAKIMGIKVEYLRVLQYRGLKKLNHLLRMEGGDE